MNGREVVGRFAPTPSGFMHAGNILCAIVAYLSAKSKGGKFIIRIEDVDTLRCPRAPPRILSSCWARSAYIATNPSCIKVRAPSFTAPRLAN